MKTGSLQVISGNNDIVSVTIAILYFLANTVHVKSCHANEKDALCLWIYLIFIQW